jgi:ceramide glucosyltransferase
MTRSRSPCKSGAIEIVVASCAVWSFTGASIFHGQREMGTWLSVLSMLCEVGAGLGCCYLVIAIFSVLHFAKRHDAHLSAHVPVSLLKPLHGDEPALFERLLANFEQRYEGAIQMVCGIRDHRDPAAAHVQQIAESRGEAVDLVVSAREHGPNRKVSNLVNMLHCARNDVLIVSDSDIEVEPNYLAKVVAHLHRNNVGAVTCLYHGVPAPGLWSRHAALAINSHFLPSMIVAITFDLAHPCCGSTIAIKRRILQDIGGFERFAEHLADDYEIGRAVRGAGYEVAVPAFTVGHHCFSESLKALLAQELRAAKTVKCIDPFGFAGAFITHPFPLALAGTLADGRDALALAAGALCLRVLLCVAVELTFALPRQPYALLPARELLSFLVYFLSFFGARINWRGTEFAVASSGALKPKAYCKAEASK